MNSQQKTTHRRVTDALRNRLTHALIYVMLALAVLSASGVMWPIQPRVLVSSAQAQTAPTPAPVAPETVRTAETTQTVKPVRATRRSRRRGKRVARRVVTCPTVRCTCVCTPDGASVSTSVTRK